MQAPANILFTTSTVFEAGRAYNPVHVFSKLECDGDYTEATRLLVGERNAQGLLGRCRYCCNRDSITINRRGDNQIINIPEPLVLIAGGMQPDLLPDFAKGNRAESGFMARFYLRIPRRKALMFNGSTTTTRSSMKLQTATIGGHTAN